MIRVAAYQAMPKYSATERVEQVVEALKKSDEENINFLCFPEGFLTGYYAEQELAKKNSIKLASVDFQDFLNRTASFNVTFIIGFNERENDNVFDSAAVIERGKLIGIQRKHYLYHNYFTSGDRFTVFQSKGISFGIVICLDTNYFEPSRLLALQGATILFSPMCNKVPLDHPFTQRPPHYSQFVARTHENRCWLVGADWIWPSDGKESCPGHSVIYDPDGREIARSRNNEQHFITTDIPDNQLFVEKGRRVHGNPNLMKQIVSFARGVEVWK
jgi:predicted amidohydrolase